MSFADAIASCMDKYFTFSGRARRSEFWWFYVFTLLANWAATVAFAATFNNPAAINIMINLVSLIFLFPTLAVGSRRLHDIGKSGWWMLLPLTIIGTLLLIVWWATDTQRELNQYGDIPEGKMVTIPAR